MPAKIDENKCEGIGACVQACPTEVIELQEGKNGNVKSFIARPDDCVECGICVDACPAGSITIE